MQTKCVPMLAAWVAATVLTAAFSGLLGFAILRLRGHYFAVGSFNVLAAFELARRGFVIELCRISMSGETRLLVEDQKIRQAYMGF